MKAVRIVLVPIWIFLFIYFLGSRSASPSITTSLSTASQSSRKHSCFCHPNYEAAKANTRNVPPPKPNVILITQNFNGSFWLSGKLFRNGTTATSPLTCAHVERAHLRTDALYNFWGAKSRQREGMKDRGRMPGTKPTSSTISLE